MKYIGVDFDGTCVKHAYPKIGEEIGAQRILKRLAAIKGVKLILHTMRSGQELLEAQQWFVDNGIELYSTNYNPTQASWTKSPKPYCHIYIDDAALGCPLIKETGERPYVSWEKIEKLLQEEGILNDDGNSTET